ncbi:HlyD family efflux transporter periplasmic adaptor subunit [Oceanirhabdus sp. W0125-5]|uniref:HlyD family efflux transporter periplasmic adaptor subunit n=1 Tax=Oceanirhabdus sp. W0125-5 TaxID=2999116 RepID=UPI0022F34334|nr:HlyD family efflux transporter periplasmic adaptor subunit [Oceanirhabdus sp. W0125-5]WBW97680.1 HlyD family efflux transporter periplasmic adaptor subunit [Oceanirhabdus sp. W0125-5]
MKNIIQNINELSDSREVLESKPHPFTAIFIYIVISLLVVGIAWSYFGELDIVVKANGIVRPTENIRDITSKVMGRIDEEFIQEGKLVKKDETLFVVNHDLLDVKKDSIENELSKIQKEIDNLKILKKSIEDKQNYFNSEEESEYYSKYQKFNAEYSKLVAEINKVNVESSKGILNNDISYLEINKNIKEYEKDIEGYRLLKESILQGKNLFGDVEGDNIYYMQYIDYINNMEKLNQNLENNKLAAKDLEDKEKQVGDDAGIGLEQLQIKLENYNKELEKYKNSYMSDLKKILKDNAELVIELGYEISSLNSQKSVVTEELKYLNKLKGSIKDNKNCFDSNDSNYKNQKYLNSYYQYKDQVKIYEDNIKNLEVQKTALENEILDINNAISNLQNTINSLIDQKNTALAEGDTDKAESIQGEIDTKGNEKNNKNIELQQKNSELDTIKKNINSNQAQFDKIKNLNLDNVSTLINEQKRLEDSYNGQLNSKYNKQMRTMDDNSGWTKLENSIKDDKNYFDEGDEVFLLKYKNYLIEIEKYKNSINDVLLQIKSLEMDMDQSTISNNNKKQEIDIAERKIKNEIEQYKNKLFLEIDTKIKDLNNTIEKYNLDKERLNNNNEVYSANHAYTSTLINQFIMDNIVAIDNSIKSNEDQKLAYEKELENVQLAIEDYIVKSPIEGKISTVRDINSKELVNVGEQIVSIISEENPYYKVEIFLSNKDISKINTGDKIKFSFDALSYKEFGYIEGEITSIGINSIVDKNSGISYYPVQAKVKNIPIYSYKGNKEEIKVGMTCRAQIITDEKKILYWLLEKINLRD